MFEFHLEIQNSGGITVCSMERNFNKDGLSCSLYMLSLVIITYVILYYETEKTKIQNLHFLEICFCSISVSQNDFQRHDFK